MRFLSRFCSVVLSLSVSLLLCLSTLRIKVYADTETVTVQLTEAQTLALYGTSFSALYFDGSSVQNVTFDYVKSSKQICDELNNMFDSWTFNNTSYNVLPSGAVNAFTMYACPGGSDLAATAQGFDNSLNFNSDWLGINGGVIISRDLLQYYDFLLYRANVAPRPVNSSSYDFQFNIQFPFVLSGVERFQSLFMTQIGMFPPSACWGTIPSISNANIRGEVRLYGTNNLVPLAVGSDTFTFGNNNYFGISYHPINTCDPETLPSVNQFLPTYNALNSCLSAFGIFSMAFLDSAVSSDLTGINWNIRAGDAQGNFLKQDFDYNYSSVIDPNDPNYQFQGESVYIMVMCPRIQGEYVIGRPSGSGGDYSAPLNDIIDKLDQIVQNLNIDLDTTNLENTIVSTGNSIVTGIKNLFIPSQTDLINFRLDLEDEFHSFFPAMYTAETKIDSVFRAMEDVSAVDYLMFPGVSVDLPAERGGSANFKINSGAVLLKPAADRLGALYDCLALAIDIIATLAFFNMLRNRFNKFFGEGAEE